MTALAATPLFDRHADEGWWIFDPAADSWSGNPRAVEHLDLDVAAGNLGWFLKRLQAADSASFRDYLTGVLRGMFASPNTMVRPVAKAQRWVQIRMWPIVDGTGRVFGTTTDSTDRMTDREHARMKDAYWRTLVNRMPVLLLVANLKGELLDAYGNPEAMFGWSLNDFIGHRDFQLVWPDDRPLLVKANSGLADGSYRDCELEFRMLHRQGHPVWVECHAYLLESIGVEPLVAAYNYLIDDRHREQARLEQAVLERTAELRATVAHLEQEVAERTRVAELLRQREEQLIRGATRQALGTLVSGVVHELGSPLATAELGIEVLHRGPLAPAQAESLARVRTALRHANEVVMALREGTPDRPQTTFATSDLADIASTALGLAEHACRRRDVIIERDLPVGTAVLFASSRRLTQVVLNLVLNAIQALPTGGGRVRIQIGVSGSEAWCRVSDTGSGMAPEVVRRLGEPFFTTRQEAGGQGLGLSVSFGIAQEHGGRIEYVSALGLGTTATLIVPLLASDGR